MNRTPDPIISYPPFDWIDAVGVAVLLALMILETLT